jgi:hypothetical protein
MPYIYDDDEIDDIAKFTSKAEAVITQLRARVAELEEALAHEKDECAEWRSSSGQWEELADALAREVHGLEGGAP